jgi:hypothetical protein
MKTTRWVKAMGVGSVLGVAWFVGIALAAELPAAPAQPATQPVVEAPATVDEVAPVEIEGVDADATCEDATFSSAETAVANDLLDSAAQAASCKPCKGRTWCKCTYNGSPRSSCNPCCYTNNIGVTVCLD